jgi:hypothetical protein
MSEIKSALEIALEKTENIKGDKETIRAHELRQKGKKLASNFLQAPEDKQINLYKEIKKYPKKEMRPVQEGAFEVCMANLSLPREDYSEKTLKRLESAFSQLTGNKRQTAYLFQQTSQFFQQYLQNRQQLLQNIEEQFKPELQKKEQEISKQIGSKVKIDPNQLPEYKKAVQQNIGRFDRQYQEAFQQVKEELEKLFRS